MGSVAQENYSNTRRNRRSLSDILLRRTSVTLIPKDSPFQFTKLIYQETKDIEFALKDMTPPEKDRNLTLLIGGDKQIGKTSLISRYNFGAFDTTYDTSITEAYRKAEGNFVLELLDSNLKDSLSNNLLDRTDIFVGCYSVNDRASFQNLK